MQSAFPFVVFGAVGVSVVMSIVFLLSRDSAYDEIGRGGLSGSPGSPFGQGMEIEERPGMSTELEQAEREQEIRQMLQARSERKVRRGEPAIDIDAEVARLTAPAAASQTSAADDPGSAADDPGSAADDPGIADEVRQLVIARNERRARQGLEPLDVQAEIRRTLAELDP
jgi:hypothetical protein